MSRKIRYYEPMGTKRTNKCLFCIALGALLAVLLVAACRNPNSSEAQAPSVLAQPWPPEVGKAYPRIVLQNYDGRQIDLSTFKGKVILIEPIGMSCPACQAFAGANKIGGFRGVRPQAGLPSIHELFQTDSGGTVLEESDVIFVQILFYDLRLKAPTLADAKAWAKHFGFEDKPNHYVLLGDESFINSATYKLIPGFQLVDKKFVLRYDATGHHPKHNLWSDLLAAVPQLIKEK